MDIDIDVRADFDSSKIFATSVKASVVKDDKLTPHPCGVYFQSMPIDPISKLAAIPYEQAEDLGFFKLDFLHIHTYANFVSKEEIRELIKVDPNWALLTIPSVVKQLFQISKHYELIQEIAPTSIEELADALAIIRPSKRGLINLYKTNRVAARRLLYMIDDGDAYGFKKAHAIAYALVIVLQLHLISAGIPIA